MKMKLVFACLILGCLGMGKLWAQPEPISIKTKRSTVVLEVSPGLGSASEANNGTRWKTQLGFGAGVHYLFSPSQRVWLQAGISEHFVSAYRVVEHPYPYVMEMKVTTAVSSTRLRAGGDYAFRILDSDNGFFYVGSALYLDHVHDATAYKRKRYVNEIERETIKFQDSFEPVVPGIQLSLGAQLNAARFELRYWEDLQTFRIPTVPLGKIRRSFLGLNGSILLSNRYN